MKDIYISDCCNDLLEFISSGSGCTYYYRCTKCGREANESTRLSDIPKLKEEVQLYRTRWAKAESKISELTALLNTWSHNKDTQTIP